MGQYLAVGRLDPGRPLTGREPVAGILAVQGAGRGNVWHARRFRDPVRTTVFWAPVTEEVAKTGLAALFAANVPVSHAVFGVAEAVGYSAAPLGTQVLRVTAHAALGLLTAAVAYRYGLVAGLAVGILGHLAWNASVVYRELARQPAVAPLAAAARARPPADPAAAYHELKRRLPI